MRNHTSNLGEDNYFCYPTSPLGKKNSFLLPQQIVAQTGFFSLYKATNLGEENVVCLTHAFTTTNKCNLFTNLWFTLLQSLNQWKKCHYKATNNVIIRQPILEKKKMWFVLHIPSPLQTNVIHLLIFDLLYFSHWINGRIFFFDLLILLLGVPILAIERYL